MLLRNRRIKIVSLALMLMVAGCIESLNPLYSPETIVYNGDILGHFVMEGGGEYEIQKGEDATSYWLVLIGQEKDRQRMHLAKIGGQVFMDLAYEDAKYHQWCRATFEQDKILLWDLASDDGPRGEQVRAFRKALKCQKSNGIDASSLSTAELQTLVADNVALFDSLLTTLKRKT